MTRKLILFATLFGLMAGGAASAQVMYGQYNLGPDYGAMFNAAQQRQNALTQSMQQTEAAIVQRTMQDPNCWAMYQQHRARGGTLTYAQFAYQYAATNGFTAEGIARFRQNEAANQARVGAAREQLRQAQQERVAAEQRQREGFLRNQNEASNILNGQQTYYDTQIGRTTVVPYIGQNGPYVDRSTGQRYQRDSSGNLYAQGPNGSWYPVAPAR